ncbi:unnamed protein product [Durusdinium trenchii]|uniref:Uncharacterized protein n=1 Tax=Durusdinium trenchii TaxID=1381693 RepID=A0ABP0L158_9DINO
MKSSVKVTSTGEQVPLNFRYSVTPASKVNSFKPKELPSDCDRRQLRAGQLGAVWCGRLQQLPRADHVGLIWEVEAGEEIPSVITPVKPKYFLLGTVNVPAKQAIKLA